MDRPSATTLLGVLLFASAPSSADELLDIGGHLVRVDDATLVLVDGEPLPAGAPTPSAPLRPMTPFEATQAMRMICGLCSDMMRSL